MRRKTKSYFLKKIDGTINGLTLGISFIVIGLFLIFVPDYFGNKLVGEIVRWIFIIFGTLGLIVEFNKFKISGINGLSDFWVGILLVSCWAALFFLVDTILGNTVGFFCLVLGVYGIILGLLRIFYSFYLKSKDRSESKESIVSDAIILLTNTASLALVVIQIVEALQ